MQGKQIKIKIGTLTDLRDLQNMQDTMSGAPSVREETSATRTNMSDKVVETIEDPDVHNKVATLLSEEIGERLTVSIYKATESNSNSKTGSKRPTDQTPNV